MQTQKNIKTTPKKDEKILVVPRTNLFESAAPQGIVEIDEKVLQEKIQKYQRFQWRSQVENDPTLKQIIPYLIFKYQDKLFLMQRCAKASEQRLKSKYSLGIGGHIRQADLAAGTILDWSQREFAEEINYTGSFTTNFIGLLNDEVDAVGTVHTGFVYLLEGNSANISIRSELQSGSLVSMQECSNQFENMERWSQIAFRHLEKR